MIHLNDNLRVVIGIKQNIINSKNVGAINGMDSDSFADYPTGFSLDSYLYFFMHPLLIDRELLV